MPTIPTNSDDGHLAAFTDPLEAYAAAAVERALGAHVEARGMPGAPRGTVYSTSTTKRG